MKCEHQGCTNWANHCISYWLNKDAMLVLYYCEEHAPEGCEEFENPEVEDAQNQSNQ